MGRSSHMKRLAMPRSWPLNRKSKVWVTRPRAGPHSLERGMALAVILRDILGLARNNREAKAILASGTVEIDGKKVKDPHRSIGLMDVLKIGESHLRCILDHNGKLRYEEIPESDASWKICRIEGKVTIKGGLTQLNLHDGRNIIVDDPKQYNTGDSLIVTLPDGAIQEHIPLTQGAKAYIIGGSHVGEFETVEKKTVKRSSLPNEIELTGFTTTSQHVFLISESTSLPVKEVTE